MRTYFLLRYFSHVLRQLGDSQVYLVDLAGQVGLLLLEPAVLGLHALQLGLDRLEVLLDRLFHFLLRPLFARLDRLRELCAEQHVHLGHDVFLERFDVLLALDFLVCLAAPALLQQLHLAGVEDHFLGKGFVFFRLLSQGFIEFRVLREPSEPRPQAWKALRGWCCSSFGRSCSALSSC